MDTNFYEVKKFFEVHFTESRFSICLFLPFVQNFCHRLEFQLGLSMIVFLIGKTENHSSLVISLKNNRKYCKFPQISLTLQPAVKNNFITPITVSQ